MAILIASGWLVARRADGAAQAATATTHTRTYLGLDCRPLDVNVFPELASNTGGGIYTLTLVGAPEPAVPPAKPIVVGSSLGGVSPPAAITVRP